MPASIQASASALARIPDPAAAFYFAESYATGLSDLSDDPQVTTVVIGTALGITNVSQMVAARGRLEAKYRFGVIEVEQDIVNPHDTTHIGVWVREKFIGDSQTQLASATALQEGGRYVLFLSNEMVSPDTSSGVPVIAYEILPASISDGQVIFNGVEYALEQLVDLLISSMADAGRPTAVRN